MGATPPALHEVGSVRPVDYTTVRTLLAGLHDADKEMGRLRADRDHLQDAYCEARLEARLRHALDVSVSLRVAGSNGAAVDRPA